MNWNYTADTENVNKGRSGIIKAGEYEALIVNVEQRTAKSGTESINVEFVLRNDVQQEYQNKHVWMDVWRTQKTIENGQYTRNINTISKVAGIQNGQKFEGFESWVAAVKNRPCKITVGIETYNDKEKNTVKWLNDTAFPNVAHKFKDTTTNTATQQPVEEETDDLPF